MTEMTAMSLDAEHDGQSHQAVVRQENELLEGRHAADELIASDIWRQILDDYMPANDLKTRFGLLGACRFLRSLVLESQPLGLDFN